MVAPFWKIRRELGRIAGHCIELPGDLHNYAFGTRHYDKHLAKKVVAWEGAQADSPRVAIFLIYPSTGLQTSHLRTLEYLSAKGYAVAVVSNLSLDEMSRERIRQACWRYIERPNFGYDFGGYRDGVLALSASLPDRERLLILNDSAWFPLPGSKDWLDQAERCDADFVGAASHFGCPRPDIENFRNLEWSYSTAHKNFHYGSFAMLIRQPILRDPAFVAYWRTFRLTNKKKRTVRRGEIGLTQWVLSRGYSHTTTQNLQNLPNELETLPATRLLEIAHSLILPRQPQLCALIERLSSDPNPIPQDLVNVILLAVARQGASYALAPYAIQEHGFSFLKKSPVWLDEKSSATTMRLLETTPDAAYIRHEAEQLRDLRLRANKRL